MSQDNYRDLYEEINPEKLYSEGFQDGAENSFNRVIKYLKQEIKNNYTDSIQGVLKDLLNRLEKMKKRT